MEEVLDQVPPFVGVVVKFCGEAAVGFGRNDRLDLGFDEGIAEPVGVKRPVGKKLSAVQPLDQP